MTHSMSERGCALGLMAKAPLVGEVKTRLVPPLTAHEAAALSICFLRDMAANIECITKASGLVVYTPAGSEGACAWGGSCRNLSSCCFSVVQLLAIVCAMLRTIFCDKVMARCVLSIQIVRRYRDRFCFERSSCLRWTAIE